MNTELSLTNRHYSHLVKGALSQKRRPWIYRGPMDGARNHKLKSGTITAMVANELAELEKAGLVYLKLDATRGSRYFIHLTDAGKLAVLKMPDKLDGAQFYPLPCDIREAKAALKRERYAL